MGNVVTKESPSTGSEPGPKRRRESNATGSSNHSSSKGKESVKGAGSRSGSGRSSSKNKTSEGKARAATGSSSTSLSSAGNAKTSQQAGGLTLEEMVDGGYLHDHGVYSGSLDYKEAIVRQLMIERRMAPFFKGLADVEDNWTDRQLLAAVRGMPIPEAEPSSVPEERKEISQTCQSSGNSSSDAVSATTTTTTITISGNSSPQDDHINDNSSNHESISDPVLMKDAGLHTDKPSSPVAAAAAADPEEHVAGSSACMPLDSAALQSEPVYTPISSSLPNSSIVDFAQFPPAQPTSSESDSHRTASSNSDGDSVASTVSTNATSSDEDDLLRHVLLLKSTAGHVEDVSAAPAIISNTSNSVATPSPSAIKRARSKTASQVISEVAPGPAPEKPIDVILYRGALECPICFLYYPKYANFTRCCAQPICSECFVQIKRPDPHLPHHEDGPTSGESSKAEEEDLLISEPAQCPFCNAPDFGIVYFPPPFKSGVCSAGAPYGSSSTALKRHTKALFGAKTPTNDSSTDLKTTVIRTVTAAEVPLAGDPFETARRRGSTPPTAPEVVTSDMIRPFWALKLTTARHHLARKSAAATALHTTAFLLPSSSSSSLAAESSSSAKHEKKKGRFRGFSVGSSNNSSGNSSSASSTHRGSSGTATTAKRFTSSSSRDYRSSKAVAKEVEEMLMMEAVRLSLYDAPKNGVPTSGTSVGTA